MRLADAFGASLQVIHVLEESFALAGYLEPYAPGDYMAAVERQARVELEAELTADQKSRYAASLAVRTGNPTNEILAYLGEHREIDLVVMATAGRGGVARFMMGSVTDRVVCGAPCPVLTLHPCDPAETDAGNRAA